MRNLRLASLRCDSQAKPLRLEIETTDTEIIITQFAATECMEGALDGNTFGSTELGEGVRGVTCQRTEGGGPEVQSLVFSKENFDEETATAWATSNEFAAHMERRREHSILMAKTEVKLYNRPFAAQDEEPGQAADAEAPKASEGMENFRMSVVAGLDKKGWTIFGAEDPPYDFIVQELYTDFVIVVDTITGKYFKLAVTETDAGIEFGEPEEYDIAYVPAGGEATAEPPAEEEPEAMAAASENRMRFRMKNMLVLSRRTKTKWPTFELLLATSGWSNDKRYMTTAAIDDAVDRNLFDGVALNVEHPDIRTGKRPGVLACGFVKPGTARKVTNEAGGVDVYGDVCMLNTKDGQEITEALDASLETGKPMVGCSVFSKAAWQYDGVIDGRPAVVIQKLVTLDAIDFVDTAAFTRSTVQRRLAAERQTAPGDDLTMKEREELEGLRKEVTKLKLEKAVDRELGESDLPDTLKLQIRPILLANSDPELRKAHIAHTATLYWASAKKPKSPGGGSKDGGGDNDTPRPLRADVQEMVNKAAKAAGIKPETLAAAQKSVMGTAADE